LRSWLDTRRSEAQKKRDALLQAWAARKSQLWKDVKEGIRYQEEKIAREIEEEKRRKEEEERQRKEEELRRSLVEAKRREEAEKKRKEEEEILRQEEEKKKKENVVQRTLDQEQSQKQQWLEAEQVQREQLGLKNEFMNWADTRYHLKVTFILLSAFLPII
jgi:nucleoporin GLE1